MKRFLIPMVFIASSSYAAGIQKWVDESGNVTYGDNPPAQTQTESIHVTRPPSNPGKPLPRLNTSEGDRETDKADAKQKKAQDKTTSEANKLVCEKAKTDLDVISRSNIIRLKQNDGTERVLSDKEIDERRTKLEKDVKQYCR